MTSLHHETVIILDFGSQYTQLIARRVREAGVYCEILPYNASIDAINAKSPKGLIFSGGPSSVYDTAAPKPHPQLLESVDCPTLGICYGFQVFARELGGHVVASPNREFGYARLKILDATSRLFEGLPQELDVWISHGDHVTEVPPGFHVTAITDDALNAMEDQSRGIYGVQFHPEVAHTPLGAQVLRNFLFSVCGLRGDWSPEAVIEEQVERIRAQLGDKGRVVSGLSGGVDSTVASALVHKAVGDRQTCIFVDNGLLREGEFESTLALLRQSMKLNIAGVRAGNVFLDALKGVTDPEEKRKRIGKVFIDVFEEEARKLGDVGYAPAFALFVFRSKELHHAHVRRSRIAPNRAEHADRSVVRIDPAVVCLRFALAICESVAVFENRDALNVGRKRLCEERIDEQAEDCQKDGKFFHNFFSK